MEARRFVWRGVFDRSVTPAFNIMRLLGAPGRSHEALA